MAIQDYEKRTYTDKDEIVRYDDFNRIEQGVFDNRVHIKSCNNQISALNQCQHIDMNGKSLINYIKTLPHGAHKCIQFQGAIDTPTQDWYYAEIFVHVFNTNYFYINLYRLDTKTTPFHGGCYGGEFSGWEHIPSISDINNLQQQLNATQEMLVNMTNLGDD